MKMRRALQRGFTAIEMMVVLAVTVFALAKGGQELTTYIDNLEYQAVAQHANLVREGGNKYIKDNYAAIQDVATAVAPATITVAMLQSTSPQYLDAAVSETNSFGQSYSILVLEPVAGQLEALIVTTGGTAISERGLRYIAQILGQQGGYVSAVDTTVATGLRGGWNKALPGNYGVSPGAGHLAIALFYGDSGTVSDYVYRNSITGRPELNTMNTPLIMASVQATGAACTTTGAIAQDGAGAVISCQGGIWRTQTGYWKDPVATYAALTALPAGSNSTGDTRIVTALGRAFTWNGASWSALALDQNGDLLAARNIVATGNLSANTLTPTLIAAEGDSCASYPQGAQAQTVSGSPLYCQSGGTWAKQSSGGGPQVTLVLEDSALYGKAGMACPAGWTNATATLPNAAGQIPIGPNGHYRMACLSPSGKVCSVTYLEDNYNFFKAGMSCPVGWASATDSMPNGAGLLSNTNGNSLRMACYVCN